MCKHTHMHTRTHARTYTHIAYECRLGCIGVYIQLTVDILAYVNVFVGEYQVVHVHVCVLHAFTNILHPDSTLFCHVIQYSLTLSAM